MPWQEPNNQNDDSNKDPKRPLTQQEELDQMAKELQEKLGRFFGGGRRGNNNDGNGGAQQMNTPSFGLLIGLFVLFWAATGLYIVDDAERGVVKRFGEYVRVTDPGLHWHIPAPIESVDKVNVDEIRKTSFDKKMLTKDENIVDVDINIQYLINDPEKFLFNVRSPEVTLEEVSRSAIREVVGKNDLDYIITTNRENIGPLTEERIQQTLDSYDIGIEVTAVNIVNANFPNEVNDAVQDAIRAREDKETSIFQAQTYANDIVPKSRGEAAKRIEDALANKAQEIADAEGEASRFNQLRVEYEKAPEVTRKRLYLETIEEVFSNTSKVIMDSEGSGNLIYLPVDQLLKQGQSSEPAPVVNSNQSVRPSNVRPATSSTSNPRARSTDRGVR